MNNLPAFPIHWENHHQGMALRDYFAAKAMQGFLANFEASDDIVTLPILCYALADAMLKAREA